MDAPIVLNWVHGSVTSLEAAEAIAPKRPKLQAMVLQAIRRVGAFGATDDELQFVLGMDASTERPRRVELVQAGLVRDSGRVRKTRRGRNAVVWVAVE